MNALTGTLSSGLVAQATGTYYLNSQLNEPH